MMNEIGKNFSCSVFDRGEDGDVKILVTDYGYSYSSPPGLTIVGHHYWILDANTGHLLQRVRVGSTIFTSEPLFFIREDNLYFAIGLGSGWNYKNTFDILVYNWSCDSYSLYDIYNSSNLGDWRYLTFVKNESDPLIVLTSSRWDILVWSLRTEQYIWEKDGITGARLFQAPIACDIDYDFQSEIIIPAGQFTSIDTISGREEESFHFTYTYLSNQVLSIHDIDNDSFAEICFGYYDKYNTKTYYIVTVDTPSPFISINNDLFTPKSTFYPELDNAIGFNIENVVEDKIPPSILFTIQNPVLDYIINFTIMTNNLTIRQNPNPFLWATIHHYQYEENELHLVLSIIPSWNFSYEGYNDIIITIIDKYSRPLSWTFEEMFRVERDLVLIGGISIISKTRGSIQEGSWVKGNESLKVLDCLIVFEGTVNIIPRVGSFELMIDVGNQTFARTIENPINISFSFNTPRTQGLFNVTIRIFQTPLKRYSTSTKSFQLRVDATPPRILEWYPEDDIWFCNDTIDVIILVDDYESGMDVGLIRYMCTPIHNSTSLDEWCIVEQTNIKENYEGISIDVLLVLHDGRFLVSWLMVDLVGNDRYFNHSVNVDLTKIMISDFTPIGWVSSQNVDCSITYSDLNGSGIKGDSLQYSMSFNDLFYFSGWHSLFETVYAPVITINFTVNAQEGKQNFIRFRGRDVAGNELLTSSVYSIWIDTIPPEIKIIYPIHNTIMSPNETRIIARIYENGSGLGEISPFLVDSQRNEYIELNYSLNSPLLGIYDITITWNQMNAFNLVMWINCSDEVLNTITSPMVSFMVNQPPRIVEISPKSKSIFILNSLIQFNATIIDPDNDNVSIIWILDGQEILSTKDRFENSSIGLGDHEISIKISDDFYTVESTFSIYIVSDLSTTSNRSIIWYIITILIIMGISVIMFKKTRVNNVDKK